MKSGKVYGLINPKTHKIFYVGCTSGRLKVRLKCHIAAAKQCLRSTPIVIFMHELLQQGITPTILLLQTVIVTSTSSESVNIAEKKWINDLLQAHHPLLNKNNVRSIGRVGTLRVKKQPKQLLSNWIKQWAKENTIKFSGTELRTNKN